MVTRQLQRYEGALGGEDGTGLLTAAAGTRLAAAEHAHRAVTSSLQVFGGYGYLNELPLGRLVRDAKLLEIGAGTSEIRRLIIGRELLK